MSLIQELYRFSSSAGLVFRHASGDLDMMHDGFSYPRLEGLSRAGYELGADITRSDLTVTVPVDSALARHARGGLLDERIDLTLFRRVDALTLVAWQGTVTDLRWAGLALELSATPASKAQRGVSRHLRYGRSCRWTLYRPGCNVDRSAHRLTTTVSAVSGRTLTVPAAAGYADGHFVAGYVEFNGVRRHLRKHVGSSIEMVAPLAELAAGATVDLYRGCDHTLTTCHSDFANSANFGGWPWTPTTDPHGKGLK